MDGARLILNARYFHIAQTGEKATKYAFVAEAAAGLVNYIATRESVIYNYDEHYKEVSATEAQREAINQFLEVSPDLELSREFKAYDEDRSAANASALISRAAQYVYGMTAEGDVKPSAPATRAQRERIQEFVNKVPAIRQTPEYSDYKASPTRENASEVLSHALEVGLANAADPETLEIMLNYIAERPGVVHNEGKVHGLFTVNGAADLAAEKEAIAAHTGNIYSMVFSLRREDADRLGYDRQDAWSQLFAIKADKIAQDLRVPTSKLHWVAAVHNTKHHPHAHFIAYSTEQKSRIYLSEDAIEQLKSEFVSEIFAEERHQIFAPREEARQQLEDRLETLFTQLEHNSNAAVTDLLLPEKLAALRKSIESASGRHVYLSVITTSMSRLLAFIDSESENILCKNSKITVADIYQKKVAVFITFPEEDATKHVLVSLFLSQIINEAIVYADERTKENKLTRRLYIFADEFGIFPYMGNILGMFGASRSRNIIIVPCIQSPAQLRQTYGADGETIIRDCCQTVIFGGFSPMSDTAVTFSKLLGNQTVAAGSVSTNNREGRSLFGSGSNSSRSVNMIARPLMTPDELQLLPFGKWVVNRRGSHPFIANMPRYDKWGIRLEAPYISETREYVPTVYAKLDDVIRTIKEGKWRQTVQEKRESANSSESVGSTADY